MLRKLLSLFIQKCGQKSEETLSTSKESKFPPKDTDSLLLTVQVQHASHLSQFKNGQVLLLCMRILQMCFCRIRHLQSTLQVQSERGEKSGRSDGVQGKCFTTKTPYLQESASGTSTSTERNRKTQRETMGEGARLGLIGQQKRVKMLGMRARQ